MGSVPRSAAGAPGSAAGVGRVGGRGGGGGGGRDALGARDARVAGEFVTVNDGWGGEVVDVGGLDNVDDFDIEHDDHFNHVDVDDCAGADFGAGGRGDDDRADAWDDQAADSDNAAAGSCHDVSTSSGGVDEVVHVLGDGRAVFRAVLGGGVGAGCVAGGVVRAVRPGRIGHDERVGIWRLWDVAGGDHRCGWRVRVVVVGELEIEREQRKS